MIETIFAFSIFCMIASFIPLLYKTILSHYSIEKRLQKMEWEVFVNQLKYEVQSSEQIIESESSLLLIKDGDYINYEKYRTNIRRRVDDKGHEIVLQNVKFVQYEYLQSILTVTVTDLYDRQFSVRIHPIIKWETDS